jgi:hypothetical protein
MIDHLPLHHMNLVNINNELMKINTIVVTATEGPTEEQLVNMRDLLHCQGTSVPFPP